MTSSSLRAPVCLPLNAFSSLPLPLPSIYFYFFWHHTFTQFLLPPTSTATTNLQTPNLHRHNHSLLSLSTLVVRYSGTVPFTSSFWIFCPKPSGTYLLHHALPRPSTLWYLPPASASPVCLLHPATSSARALWYLFLLHPASSPPRLKHFLPQTRTLWYCLLSLSHLTSKNLKLTVSLLRPATLISKTHHNGSQEGC